MNVLIIINDGPYGTEAAFKALHLARWTLAADEAIH